MGAVFCIAMMSACGYELTANSPIVLPQDSTKLFLSKVTNPTTETWLEPMIRTSLRDELTRRGNVVWVSQTEAQATVTVDVRSYSTADAVKGRDDVTVKSEARIQLEVSFFDARTNALIWTSGPVMATESYRTSAEARANAGHYLRPAGKREATQNAVDLAMRMVADRLGQKF